MEVPFKIFLFFLFLIPSTTSASKLTNRDLPLDPIYFQKPITDQRQLEEFLLSNANIGKAEIHVCLSLPPPSNQTDRVKRQDDPVVSSPEPEITSPAPKATEIETTKKPPPPPPVQDDTPWWAVGSCHNNYTVKTIILEVTLAKKFLILKVIDMFDAAWPSLHTLVRSQRFILINWPIVLGPGSDSVYMKVVDVPKDLTDVQGVLLSFREGNSAQDNEDDRYWYYHFEQMADAMESRAIKPIPVKIVAFNGLYLTRSSASDLSNCTRATGFFHYLNDKDTVRLNALDYKRRLADYEMTKKYNIWAISEFVPPDFNSAAGGWVNWRVAQCLMVLGSWGLSKLFEKN